MPPNQVLQQTGDRDPGFVRVRRLTARSPVCTADPLNPVGGGEIRIGQKTFGAKPAILEMIGKWVKMFGCSDEMRVVYDKDGASGIAYGFPGEAAKVMLYTIEAHGHHWPGGKSALPETLAGENTAKIRATDVIWEFFKSHPPVDLE